MPVRSLLRPRQRQRSLAQLQSASPGAIISAVVTLIIVLGALAAPLVAPHNPFDLASLNIMDANTPAWEADGNSAFVLGTDDQGRDILSAILYGSRVSLLVALPRCCSPWSWASRSG